MQRPRRFSFPARSVYFGAAALAAACAHAETITWTGAAGPAQPFWDVITNWSPPLPESEFAAPGTDWLELGPHDTTLRSGQYAAAGVRGGGTLSVTGGLLALDSQPGSSLGALRFTGGVLMSPRWAVGSLHWSGGSFSGYSPSAQHGEVTVTGSAHITGSADRRAAAFSFGGDTLWDGTGTVTQRGLQHVDTPARFTDHATAGGHEWVLEGGGTYRIDGAYEKTGGAASTVTIERFSGFANHGLLTVREGALQWNVGAVLRDDYLYPGPTSSWLNAGRIDVAGGSLRTRLAYANASHTGQVTVRDGSMRVDLDRTQLVSTGDWTVGERGTLTFSAPDGVIPWREVDLRRGVVHVDGQLVVDGAGVNMTVPDVKLTGSGTLFITEGGRFEAVRNSRSPSARVSIARIRNAGTMVLNGVDIDGELRNQGVLRVVPGGTTVHGKLDNTGLVSVGRLASMDLRGGLEQWRNGVLEGGRYELLGGRLFLPTSAEVLTVNRGDITIRQLGAIGAIARRDGRAVFEDLQLNEGRLALEFLSVNGPLENRGFLEVARTSPRGDSSSSTFRLNGVYTQRGADAQTWLGGKMVSHGVVFHEGTVGVGAEGLWGPAEFDAPYVEFGDTTIRLLGSTSIQQLFVTGTARLDGFVEMDFSSYIGPGHAPLGRYRFLVAGDIEGRFDGYSAGLDSTLYRTALVYGDDYVELYVASVPEPGTYALMALGLAGLAWRGRRRAAAGAYLGATTSR
jgi:hypothetical protein